ncbi:hypothetical protein [Streptomyces sp. NPDC058268]|uniref:hypothetical protein n=1 Tax=Streptomyces sp. NPDC058268 TaxID=3346413 RepID=UPI0036E80218
MAQDSWPSPAHNSRAVTDTEYEKIAAHFSDDGTWGTPTDTAVVSAGSGLSVNVRAEVYASVRGHAWYSGASAVNLAIGANSSGSTRTDRVVLRLDRSAWTVRAVVKAGTPGAGAPTLTQQTGDTGVYEIPLARVTVLNGASAVSVTREELYVGTRLRPALSSARNPNPVRGEVAYEIDTGRLKIYDGTAWGTAYDNSGSVSVDSTLSAWEITVESVLEKRSGNVHLRLGAFNRKGGSLAGGSDSRLPVLIPSAYRHASRNMYAIAYITGADIGRLTIYPTGHERAGQVWLTQKPDISNGDDVLPGTASWVVD